MSLTNPLDDAEVTDPRAMRALAHPTRLAILSRLQRHGPSTATGLSEHVGATPSVVSWHLRHLGEFGLVTPYDAAGDKRQRWWQAPKRGFRFTVPDDAEGQAAARLLRSHLRTSAAAQVDRWAHEVEPLLDGDWDRVAGTANTRVRVSAQEAAGLHEDIERLLAPYVLRAEADAPTTARAVRVLRFFMPAADEAGDV